MSRTSDPRVLTAEECKDGFGCRKCAAKPARIEFYSHDSWDEAHTDYHYRCLDCGHQWWSEGSDY